MASRSTARQRAIMDSRTTADPRPRSTPRAVPAPSADLVVDPCSVCGKPMTHLAEPVMTRSGVVEWQHSNDRTVCLTRKNRPAGPVRTAPVGARLSPGQMWGSLTGESSTGRRIEPGEMLAALVAFEPDAPRLVGRATAVIFSAVRETDRPYSAMRLGNLAPIEPNPSRGQWLEQRAATPPKKPARARRRAPKWWETTGPDRTRRAETRSRPVAAARP